MDCIHQESFNSQVDSETIQNSSQGLLELRELVVVLGTFEFEYRQLESCTALRKIRGVVSETYAEVIGNLPFLAFFQVPQCHTSHCKR